MTLALDGTATNSFTSTATGTVTVTTSDVNDVICVVVGIESTSGNGAAATVNSVTATGLTFTKRSASTVHTNSNNYVNIELWTAPSASAVTSKVITVTCTSTPAVDCAGIIAFGVNGANSISSPWDSNANFPSESSSGTICPTVTVNTSQAKDFILVAGVQGTTNNGSSVVFGSPFTQIAVVGNPGGVNLVRFGVGYNIVSSTQSSLTVASNAGTSGLYNNSGTNAAFAVIADAITASSLFLPAWAQGKNQLSHGQAS